MAILKNLTEFTGSLGNISAYRRKDSDKVILRMKGGATKKKIKTAKSFEQGNLMLNGPVALKLPVTCAIF
jgi:hypothetical protein